MTFPRILILGQAFETSSGGGITLSNLFKGWPIEKIAVATAGEQFTNVSTTICRNYYQLGDEEYIWIFPFNLFMPSVMSGSKSFDTKAELNDAKKKSKYIFRIRTLFVSNIFGPFIRWTGLFFCAMRVSLSEKFKNWLMDFKPEALYIQAGSRSRVLFAIEICDFLKIPSAIHIMDDWPSTICQKGLFKHYWNKRIDIEFRQLLNLVGLHLSISDAMTNEYRLRYNKDFIPFHNPIETEIWLKYCKSDFEINENDLSVLYAGRIGEGISESIFEVASAIDEMRSKGQNIKLYIQAPTVKSGVIKLLKKHCCVVINPTVDYNQIPEIFSSADILLLANDFNPDGLNYLKFSMPTKATEYMISGTPVFVYAPKESAVSRFFMHNECGFCVSEENKDEIIQGLKYLIKDTPYRKKISQNAVNLAKEKFDAKKVRKEFQQLLIYRY